MFQRTGEVSIQVVRPGREVGVVRGVSLASQRVVLPAHVGGRHPLLLLPPVAKPDPDHLLLQLELLCQYGDLLGGGLWTLEKMML